jgi:hypothetical protein
LSACSSCGTGRLNARPPQAATVHKTRPHDWRKASISNFAKPRQSGAAIAALATRLKANNAQFAGIQIFSAMDRLTFFGLISLTAMLVCYALEERSPWFIIAFAGSCAMGSVYGVLQGAWPFGQVEAVWSLVALRRWWSSRAR